MSVINLHHGDCIEILSTLDAESVDTCLTDPPYGLGFMGKEWDSEVPASMYWEEIYRVLKPGAILMAFGGTRTWHRLACAIEDAGFEIRDTICWLYGQGFPKSYNISKGIEGKLTKGSANWNKWKELEGERQEGALGYTKSQHEQGYRPEDYTGRGQAFDLDPQTKEAELWSGWGTSLKPAFEPIIMAMKPREGSFVDNALKHGVAGLNIDGGRIPTEEEITINTFDDGAKPFGDAVGEEFTSRKSNNGRWPSNVILDEESAKLLDEQSGVLQSGLMTPNHNVNNEWGYSGGAREKPTLRDTYADKGGASRFFYCSKAGKAEKNEGLEGIPARLCEQSGGAQKALEKGEDEYLQENHIGLNKIKSTKNHHPSVKPIDLMRYLAKLTATPTGGIILDPFMGSGTTGIAAFLEGRDFIGIEKEKDYFEIAQARIEHYKKMPQQLTMEL